MQLGLARSKTCGDNTPLVINGMIAALNGWRALQEMHQRAKDMIQLSGGRHSHRVGSAEAAADAEAGGPDCISWCS